MRSPARLAAISLVVLLTVALASPAQSASITINSPGTFSYQRELITDGISATVDPWYSISTELFANSLTNESDATLVGEGTSEFGWITTNIVPGLGEVKWHFQTAGSLVMENDFVVTYSGVFFDFPGPATGDRQEGIAWSTDNITYQIFDTSLVTPGSGVVGFGGTTALSVTGFPGGSDLYIRIQLRNDSDDFRNVQLFRDHENNDGVFQFEVTGTISAVIPEPGAFGLTLLGLLSLCGFGWRRRRSA